MWLPHKYGMNPGTEWEAVWVVSSLLEHYDSQSSVVLEDASCFGQVIFSMPDSGTWVFRSLARGRGWCQRRQRPARGWRGLQGVTFPRPGLHDSQHQWVLLPPALTLSPSSPNLEGWHQGTSHFPLPLALLKYNNQTCLIKWVIDFISKVEGMAMEDPVLVTEHHSIPFSKRSYEILYII